MWGSLTPRWAETVRRPHVKITTVTHRNLITGVSTVLPFVDGSVTDDASSNTRRSLSLTLPGQRDLWNVLDTQGGELTVTQGFLYGPNVLETIPLGVFVVDVEQANWSPGGTISLTCPDRWVKIQRNRFGLNRSSVPTNTAWQEIKRLVEGAWPGTDYPFPGWASIDHSATTKVGVLSWDDGDREGALVGDSGLATVNSLDVYFNRQGLAVLEPTPVLPDAASVSDAVWTVDQGSGGVLVDADESRDRTNLRNAIIITSSASDVVFDPVEVKITTPGDPLAVTGPLGYVAEDWASSSFRNSAQARTAGFTRLRKRAGYSKQISLKAAGNPALDSNDIIAWKLPLSGATSPVPTAVGIADQVVHEFQPGGTQSIETRATRPLTDGDDG